MFDAGQELIDAMLPGETVEAIVFGEWGWGGFGQPEHFVPQAMLGKVVTLTEALPWMVGWSFFGGFGAPECYAIRVWTNLRVLWVTQYDGSTSLSGAPRHPLDHMPTMPGGG